MVKGLDVFREWFAAYADQYVLIGGTAASLTMEENALEFRATKDLDIVLHVEALTPAFGQTFWAFIEAGAYEIRQVSGTGKPAFYRFQKPADQRFPVMLELFAKAPDALRPIASGHLTPIPFEDAVSSLSAILLNDIYYAFIMDGAKNTDGLSWVRADRLIPLKAVAWLEMTDRKQQGEHIDAKSIRKHVNDILRVSQLFTAATSIPLADSIKEDMRRFLRVVAADISIDPQALNLGSVSLNEILERIAHAYGLEGTAAS
ncbi:MAG: hypothetical protein JNJ51_08335 [Methylobacillus glycogenes]|nr:hypothetical protein [Methylobacillus glycogenes]